MEIRMPREVLSIILPQSSDLVFPVIIIHLWPDFVSNSGCERFGRIITSLLHFVLAE